MKKAELQVGGTYALVAPAHRDNPVGHAHKVMVVDLERGVEKHYACDSWSSPCNGSKSRDDDRANYPGGLYPNERKVQAFDGRGVIAVDHTTTSSWGGKKARGITVLEHCGTRGGEERWDLRAYPTGMLAMTWEEYQSQVAARKVDVEARAQAQAEHEAETKALRRQLVERVRKQFPDVKVTDSYSFDRLGVGDLTVDSYDRKRRVGVSFEFLGQLLDAIEEA
jgi:hypothetical protein